MGEAIRGVKGSWPDHWDLVDCTIGRDGEVRVHQGATSVSVSKNAQKNFGESTHPISSTRSMQTVYTLSPGADGMTYANSPIYDGLMVQWWHTSVTSISDIRTGPWTGSAYQTTCRMREKFLPNCRNSSEASLSVVLLTLGMYDSGCDNRLSIRCGRRCA